MAATMKKLTFLRTADAQTVADELRNPGFTIRLSAKKNPEDAEAQLPTIVTHEFNTRIVVTDAGRKVIARVVGDDMPTIGEYV